MRIDLRILALAPVLALVMTCSAQNVVENPSGAQSVTQPNGTPFSITGGNVGIGTTNPGSALDIVGNGFSLSLIPGWGNGQVSGAIGFNREAATGSIFNPASYAFQLTHYPASTSTSSRLELEVYNPSGNAVNYHAFVVTGAGNVGINTASPGAQLEVDGNILLGNGGSITFPDGSTQTTAFINNGSATINVGKIVFPDNSSLSSASSLGSSGGGISGQGTPNTIPIFTSSSALGSSNISVQNGNVGIGTTTPAQKLSISYGSLDFDNFGFSSSYRSPSNNYTNLFLGGALTDGGSGTYTVQTDGGSNYFAAIIMDNSGENAGAINFYTGASNGGTSYTLSGSQLSSYKRMTIVGGNVGIGTASPSSTLEVDGNLTLTQGSGASIKFPDGTVQGTAYTGTCTATGGDYAESVDVVGLKNDYQPGDVMAIDASSPDHFRKASTPYSKRVAGIYSTKPGYVGRRQSIPANQASDEIPMAMIGVVPTKVTTENGAIEPGDLLVSSSKEGYAMKGTDPGRMLGTVIGKAMGSLDSGNGVIEVLVTLQ